MICSTELNASATLGLKCIAKVTPVTIWIPRQTANKDPKFQA